MSLDVTQPANTLPLRNWPSYLRGVWANNLDPSYIVYSLWWYLSGTLTTGTNKDAEIVIPVISGRTPTVESVLARVKTAPTGAAIRVDINKNGTTIFTTQANRPNIAVSTLSATAAVPDDTAVADGDVFTLDVDAVGSTIAGADLTVLLKVKQKVIFG